MDGDSDERVFPALSMGDVSKTRDRGLILRLMEKVRQAASSTTQAIMFAVDGFAAYPNAILRTFYTNVRTGRPGRPRHIPWPNLHIVQVIKSRSGMKLNEITRKLVYGSQQAVDEMIHLSQAGFGLINTAFIERLNGTFRSRMPSLVRRTRSLDHDSDRTGGLLVRSGIQLLYHSYNIGRDTCHGGRPDRSIHGRLKKFCD